jgi:predicted nucleic acid-binding protein
MILVDTGAWFARFVPDDPDHAAVMAWLASNDQPPATCQFGSVAVVPPITA